MNSTPSLDSLSSRPPPSARPARRLPSWSIPAALLLGFAVLFLALFGDRLLPAPKVDVAIVLATPAHPDATSAAPSADGSPAFQASGWIEPAPYPVKAASLVDGVVETVHVLQGQLVKKGDLLATLIAEDAELGLASARQKHRTLVSTHAAHQAAIAVAKTRVAGLEAAAAAAATLRDEADDQFKRVDQLKGGAVSQSDVVTARLRMVREESQHAAAVSAVDETRAEVARLEAESQVRQDEIAAAALEVDAAELALRRTRIVSPVDGRVLRLLAAPGQKKMLEDLDHDSSTIAILYQPESLQVRVDVPLADAAGLQIGQPVRIRCSLLPETVLHGRVTLISGEADVQRNTLQAKVSIDDPVDALRPEMLCRVEFLQAGPAPGPPAVGGSGALAMWIPEQALVENSSWVCDAASKRVRRQAVAPSTETRDGFIRITGGLRPGQWVVLVPAGLRDGKRVTPNLVQP